MPPVSPFPPASDPPSAAALAAAVRAALVPVPDAGENPVLRCSRRTRRQLREEIVAQRAAYHARLSAGTNLSDLHRVLSGELRKLGVAPVAYNTLLRWLSPLP